LEQRPAWEKFFISGHFFVDQGIKIDHNHTHCLSFLLFYIVKRNGENFMAEPVSEFGVLLEAIRAGDNQALTQLLKKISGPLHKAARKLIGRPLQPHLDSVDLVQAVILILWQGLRNGKFQITTQDHLISLLKTLLRRTVARHWRTLKPITAATLEGSLDATVVDQPLIPPGREPDPGRASEIEDTVENLLNQLDEVDRRLLVLRYDGHSTAEAARQLGMDPAFLRVRLSRLRKRLQHHEDL
jgi:RNA polymerase sigma factor (sigma-70 family)